jgi:hypothetical protein
MSIHRRFLAALALCVMVGALLAAGCGDDDDESGGGSTTATSASAALTIEERVVEGDLGGLASAGPAQVARTPEEFVELVDSTEPVQEAAAMREAGFVEGAVMLYQVGAPGDFALSAAIQFGSPQQALAEADRIADDLPPPGSTEEPLPGVPGSRTVTSSGSEGSFGSAVFADGPFVYVVLAGGSSEANDPQAVLDAASTLYERVEGSPAP